MEPKVTGIVLAGGKSSRMGTDKALIHWNGKVLLEHAIDKLKPLCSKVIISANNSAYGFTGCEIWPDELPEKAPIIGIYSCLKRSETDLNLFLSCDIPLIPGGLLTYLIQNLGNYDIAVPVHDLLMEPLCAVYHKNCIPGLKEWINQNNFRLHQFINSANSIKLDIHKGLEFYHPLMFSNINQPNDLNYLVQNAG